MGLFFEALAPTPGARVLDLACGAGRHLDPLEEAGLWPVGLDLSAELLRRATERGPAGRRLVRGDMRVLPFAGGSFEAVSSFFTSFGYFSTVGQDIQVLEEVRRVLVPGGGFFLDFLNSAQVRSQLVPEDRRQVDDSTVIQRRRIEQGSVVKVIEIQRERGEPSRESFEERVRLYAPGELGELLRRAGLEVEGRYGGYDGRPPGPDSERMILAGRRP